jgi:hypothetical protein
LALPEASPDEVKRLQNIDEIGSKGGVVVSEGGLNNGDAVDWI